MNVLITGATGYIGQVVAEKLRGAGHDVLALARDDRAKAQLAESGYQAVAGDLAHLDALTEAASGLEQK